MDDFDPSSALLAAHDLSEKGEHVEAIAAFGELIDALSEEARASPETMGTPNDDPSDGYSGYAMLGIACAWRAESFASLGRMKEARDSADRAVRCALRHAHVHHMRAKIYMQSGRLKDATKMIERAAELDPESAEVYKIRTELLVKQNRPKEALAYSEKALRLSPGDPGVYASKAMALSALERHDEALELIDTAIRLGPDDATLHGFRTLLRARAGDVEGARASARDAARIDPENVLNKACDKVVKSAEQLKELNRRDRDIHK